MTSPAERITVVCPECGETYEDWHRASINLDLDDFSDAYIEEVSTAKCPKCGHVADLGVLVVRDGLWRID